MVFAAALAPLTARAIVTVRPPPGWIADASGDAHARVSGWIATLQGARIVRVYTTGGRDAFAEALALVEIQGPFGRAANDAAELDAVLSGIPGFIASTATWSRDETSSTPRLLAQWQHDDIAYRAELIASGETRTVLVAAMLASETVLYGRVFEETSASVDGAEAPRTPFDRNAWRARVLVPSALAAAALVGIALWRRPFDARARDIGRVLAIVIVVASLVGAQLTSSTMAVYADGLQLAAITSGTLGAEVATWGLLGAVITWAVGSWLGRSDGPVASAPPRGTFADRSSASLVSVPMIPKVPPRAETTSSPRHPDGPSRLEQVTSPPGGGLQPVDPAPTDRTSRP